MHHILLAIISAVKEGWFSGSPQLKPCMETQELIATRRCSPKQTATREGDALPTVSSPDCQMQDQGDTLP